MLGEVRDVIVRQVGHMSRLVEDVLDATRVSRGTIVLRKESVNLADVVARAVEDVRPMMDARRHELVITDAGGADRPARRRDPAGAGAGEPADQRRQVHRPGRSRRADRRPERRRGGIRVCDTGIGLAPEAVTGLFQLFSQVDATHDRSRSGLGIGLALVKSLVELHGGAVWAASDGPGRGSEFTVRLPVAGDE